MKKIVVVGSANMDSTLKVDSFDFTSSFLGEGLNKLGAAKSDVLGGKGANQAVSAKLQSEGTDTKIYFIGCVGEDESGVTVLENLHKLGIDYSGVEVLKGKNTDGRMIFVDNQGQNRMIGYGDCIKELKPELLFDEKRRKILDDADYILAQMKMPKETVEALIKYAEENNKPMLLDPTPLENSSILFDDNLINKIKYLTPNEEEAYALAMYEKGLSPNEAKKRFENLILLNNRNKIIEEITKFVSNHPNVIATLGDQGVVYNEQGKIFNKKPYTNKCIDSTGAGDTFNGAFIAAISRGENIHTAIDYALADCAVKIQHEGAQNGMQKLSQTKKYLQDKEYTM